MSIVAEIFRLNTGGKMADNHIKRTIIVGATSGIGKEMALYFARQGWSVVALGRRKH